MQPPSPPTETFAQFLTVKQAALYLGVAPGTLRGWDQAGKLRAQRHPINGYRLYERAALDALLANLRAARGASR